MGDCDKWYSASRYRLARRSEACASSELGCCRRCERGKAESAKPDWWLRSHRLTLMRVDPECYHLGREKLGLSADSKVLVVEDSPAGIRAGKCASCSVIGLATTHSIAQLRDNKPDWIVKDLRSVRFVNRNADTGEVAVEISSSLE